MSTTTTTTSIAAIELLDLQTLPKPTNPTPSPQQDRTSSATIRNSNDIEIPPHSTTRTLLAITTPSLISFLASFTNGLITVGLPLIARSLSLERSLYLWPSSVYGLTAGASLLICGSIADIVGARPVELVGTMMLGGAVLASGFARSGEELVAFRALQGVALGMHLPASVAIITGAVPAGRARNLGFACLGFSQPLGFAVGLVLSGVMIERSGWRLGFWVAGGCLVGVAVAGVWTVPKGREEGGWKGIVGRIGREIDWVGGGLASGGLAILAYVLAIISADLSSIRAPLTATLLTLSIILLLAFPLWMRYRTSHSKPALVPNALWSNLPFTATCIMVALSGAVVNAIELFSSLYFQEIQHRSTLTTSLYLLPNLTAGIFINIATGLLVHRISARWLICTSSLLCALSPLGMALMDPAWSYWYMAFWAQIFAPVSADVLFTVGLIIVSESFGEREQALAGAVFNTVSQFGMSLGMGSCQVVALGVQGGGSGSVGHGGGGGGDGAFEQSDDGKLLRGYRASYWLMFGYMVVCGGIAVVGLRRAGRVGLKRE